MCVCNAHSEHMNTYTKVYMSGKDMRFYSLSLALRSSPCKKYKINSEDCIEFEQQQHIGGTWWRLG